MEDFKEQVLEEVCGAECEAWALSAEGTAELLQFHSSARYELGTCLLYIFH